MYWLLVRKAKPSARLSEKRGIMPFLVIFKIVAVDIQSGTLKVMYYSFLIQRFYSLENFLAFSFLLWITNTIVSPESGI